MVEEGKRKSVTVCKELNFWIRTLYVNDISFEWFGDYVKIITEHCKEFEMLIFFNGNGVREAKYSLGRETHHFYFKSSLESIVYKTLDEIENQETEMA